MSDRENYAANREALANSTVHTGPGAERYEAAFRRYLAAVAYEGERFARAREAGSAREAPVASGTHGSPAADEVHWDLQDAAVRDVMTADVVSIGENATFREIVDTLTTNRISAVPVVDADRRVIGVVSESDLLAKVVTGGDPHAHIGGTWRARSVTRRKSQADTAAGLMTSPAVTTGPDTSVVEAARVAAAERIRRMPVVDDSGHLVGIVTRSDLLYVFDRSDDDIRTHVVEDILRDTFCVSPLAVQVTVEQGVVTLDGELEKQAMVNLVVKAVRSTQGVVSVNNRLSYRVADEQPAPVIGPMY